MTLSETLANAVGQYRNAYIQCLVNKADPFLAAHFADLILAGLPPAALKDDTKASNKKPELPKEQREWIDDPDNAKYQREAHEYAKKLMLFAEEKQAKAVFDTMAEYRS